MQPTETDNPSLQVRFGRWLLTSDSFNFLIREWTTSKTGKQRWVTTAYYQDLAQALRHLCRCSLRAERTSAVKDLIAAVEHLETEVERVVREFHHSGGTGT